LAITVWWSIPQLPSGYVKIAIENDHLQWNYPLKIVIFHSYVSLPEGMVKSLRDHAQKS
jgi:hypothetical protein